MSKYWLNVALARIAVPSILVACTVWRPVGLSVVYLVLALASPWVPIPSPTTMNGNTGRFFITGICLSFLMCVIQITFHIVLLAFPPYGHFLENCGMLETILRHIGLVRLNEATPWEFFYWISPEVVAFPSSTIIYFVLRRLNVLRRVDEGLVSHREAKKSREHSAKVVNFLGSIGTYAVLAALCCAGALKPSVEGGFYFLVFIGSATWWACHRELRRGFALVCRLLLIVVALHIVVLLSYQNQWPQQLLPGNATWARYFGLEAIYEVECQDPRDVRYANEDELARYGYPLRMFLLYFVLALQSKFLFRKPKPTSRTPTTQPNERTPLMRFGSGRTGLLQDSIGSVTVQDGQQEDNIQLQSLSEGASEEKPGILEHVIMAVFSVFQLIVNSSYLATNIIMMTWSIMYHSWTTFILLLWALVLWLVPSKRAAMMKNSPFVVLYSTLLLLVQYVYSMDLTESELPTVIHGIKMADIGFKKTSELSCWHLIVKCLFMTMFWITMRQHYAEKMQQRRSSTLRDMVAPLHVSVTAATATMGTQAEPEIKSKFMKDVGVIVKELLTKFWIAVVAMMLFTSGITGERMTVFRIIYMSLFLIFIITFQVSWVLWRKMMYGFWITVIGYSVMMLILVYTYQFPDFPEYWERYLHVSGNLQKDIGLITYDTKDLFVRLLTPTFFVIISVLQMHYFHRDFLEVTDIRRTSDTSRKDSLGHSSKIPTVSPTHVELSDHREKGHVLTLKELKRMSKLERIVLFRRITSHVYNFYNHTWLFFEMHMYKIIFIAFVLLSINDVCAINFCFIVTIAVVINFRRTVKTLVINILATAVAVLMVIKMLYQIDYIKHEDWDRNCTEHLVGNQTQNATDQIKSYNMAEWIGLKKVSSQLNLSQLLEGYIWIIAVTTLRAIISVRQWFYRQERGEPLGVPFVMFPSIKRVDADKGILPCIKFLFNYGFYKFGLELCLIMMVALIGFRLDFYSLLYSIWLIILFSLKRKTTSRVWPFLKMFAIVMFPLQYAMVLGPPTWLCINYPWRDSVMLTELQSWMFLPSYPDMKLQSKKLMCDFVLMFMIVRQSLVFRIEEQSLASGQEFAAGHNYSVFKDMDKPNFVNPVKDYVSHIHNFLDVFKRGCFMGLMWITLSIVFLAGTERTNLFSLGYLVGAFVFLWQGNDFYLRPVMTILKWWNWLIGYNIFVLFCKSVFQGIGCICLSDAENLVCWPVQLLGIACLKKFENPNDQFKMIGGCEVHREDIGMFWDGLCFGFLIFMKRLFRSYYFFHIVDETKAMSILASRGAELLEELHQKRIQEQENLEKAVLQKIKFKMDKIKANQRKIQGPSYREPKTHKIDSLYDPVERPMFRSRPPKTHGQAVRSGDYYMFDDMDDDDLTDLFPEKESSDDEQHEDRRRTMTVTELMNVLIKTDIEIATHVALSGGTQEDAMKIQRTSDPAKKPPSISYQSARSDSDTAAATDLPEQDTITSGAEDDATEREVDDDFDESRADGEDKEPEEPKVSITTYIKFIWAFINSTMSSMTRYLNKYSSDYRYIGRVLEKEKQELKAKPDFRMGTRLGINQMWQPLPIVRQRSSISGRTAGQVDDPGEGPSTRDIRTTKSSAYSRGTYLSEEDDEKNLLESDQPPIIRLAASIWFGILAHSTFLCYFMVFVHQIKNASVLSTPLPLMVFLWGSLTIPRPSKTFWITLIAYVEVIVIIKCICQPVFLRWNQTPMSATSPFELPRIIGIERKPNYALWDLLLLLVIFFHRLMLKSLGQWTKPSVKLRNQIPSGLTVAIARPPESVDNDNEIVRVVGQSGTTVNVNDEIKTPKGMTLTLQVADQADQVSHLAATGDNERLVVVQASETNLMDQNFAKAMRLTISKYFEPMNIFYANILDQTGKEKTNVYAYMFFCDFFNFLLLIFGFSSFGAQQGDGGVASYLAENRVPMQFLLMLLLQFGLIVIDRALFLKKSIAGKFWFQYCLVIGVHIWMFIILPSATEIQFNAKLVPQIWYMVKCFYLLLAAYQLRLGYPTRILGNFLCQKFTIVHYCLFKGFMTIPFLFEMRAVMDWIWTDTSMTVMDWFKMEDIYSSIYSIKCMRNLEDDYPQERGVKKNQISKYMTGGGALLLMIGMIWFPLLLFALGSTVGHPNLPHEVDLNIRINSYEPIYTIGVQNSSILPYTEKNFNDLKELYEMSRKRGNMITDQIKAAITFLENYEHTDVAAVKISSSSGRLWSISPPDRDRLIDELKSDNIITINAEWTVSRKPPSKEIPGVTSSGKSVRIEPNDPVREDLIHVLIGSESSENSTSRSTVYNNRTVILKNLLPMFLKVTARAIQVVPQLSKPLSVPKSTNVNTEPTDDSALDYRDVALVVTNNSLAQQWFSIHESCNDSMLNSSFSEIPLNDCNYIMMYMFNDKIFPEGLSFFSGLGIFGLYTTAVILVGGFIKKMVSDVTPKIMFEDLPYVDRIMRLCLDIYLVRESGDLCLEEDLFAKLVFLFRSPETMIRWTRLPDSGEQTDGNGDNENYNEIDDDSDDDDDVEDSQLRRRKRSTNF